MLRRRQRDQPLAVHAQQGNPAGHVLEAAVGLAPAELGADGAGDGLARGQDAAELADAVQFAVGEVPPAVDGGHHEHLHGRGAEAARGATGRGQGSRRLGARGTGRLRWPAEVVGVPAARATASSALRRGGRG